MMEAAAWRAREIVKRDSREGWISARERSVCRVRNSSQLVILAIFDEGGLCEGVVATNPAVVDVEKLVVCG